MKNNQHRAVRLKNLFKASLLSGLLSFALAVEASPNQKSFFSDNSTIIYGSQDKATSKDENIIAYNLKKQMKSYINTSADNRVSDNSLKRTNLIILGHEKSNTLLNFTNMANVKSNFPLTIGEGSFTFGNKTYNDKNAAISFIYPSPYNAKNYVLVYYSNSLEGLENIAKNSHMGLDSEYQLLNEQGKVIREGKFNKMNYTWNYDVNLDREFGETISQ